MAIRTSTVFSKSKDLLLGFCLGIRRGGGTILCKPQPGSMGDIFWATYDHGNSTIGEVTVEGYEEVFSYPKGIGLIDDMVDKKIKIFVMMLDGKTVDEIACELSARKVSVTESIHCVKGAILDKFVESGELDKVPYRSRVSFVQNFKFVDWDINIPKIRQRRAFWDTELEFIDRNHDLMIKRV